MKAIRKYFVLHFFVIFGWLIYSMEMDVLKEFKKNNNPALNFGTFSDAVRGKIEGVEKSTLEPDTSSSNHNHWEIVQSEPTKIKNPIWNYLCEKTLMRCFQIYESIHLELNEQKVKDEVIPSLNEIFAENSSSAKFGETYKRNSHEIDYKINSLNHPICYDVFTMIGSCLSSKQINWIIKHAPSVILENAQCLKSLNDYSFIDGTVYKNKVSAYVAGRNIDFLQIQKFWETSTAPFLMQLLVEEFNPEIHNHYLLTNMARIVLIPGLFENPIYYPFVSQISEQAAPFINPLNFMNYQICSRSIIDYIKRRGVDRFILLSLLSYIYRTNRMISAEMKSIANLWADLNSNYESHDDFLTINIAFKTGSELSFKLLNRLHYAREQINETLDNLRIEDIKFFGERAVFITSLRLVCQVAFDVDIRNAFQLRNKINNQLKNPTSINRMISRIFLSTPRHSVGGFNHLEPVLECVQNCDNPYSTIYRDRYGLVQVNSIIRNWELLFRSIRNAFTSNQLNLQFLQDISYPVVNGSKDEPIMEQIRVRTLDAESVLYLLSKLNANERFLANPVSEEFHEMWSDYPEISLILKDIVNTQARRSTNGFRYKISVSAFEEILDKTFDVHFSFFLKCKAFENQVLFSESLIEASGGSKTGRIDNKISVFLANNSRFFKYSKKTCSTFLMLGDDLSIEEISQMESSKLIMSALETNVRLISPNQVINLLKTEEGSSFLRNIPTISKAIFDYSLFTRSDIDTKISDLDYIVWRAYTRLLIAKVHFVPPPVEIKSSDTYVSLPEPETIPEQAHAKTETVAVAPPPVKKLSIPHVPQVDIYDPILCDERVRRMGFVERNILGKFNFSNGVSGTLHERLGSDHILGDLSGYSWHTFTLCESLRDVQFLLKKQKRSFQTEILNQIVSGELSENDLKSLNHPMCFDSFKRVGKVITAKHIEWFVDNAPFVIFDNIELLISLEDFSFYTLEVHSKVSNRFPASKAVDLLGLEAFWRTAPLEFLFFTIKNRSNGKIPWEMLAKYRPIEYLISDSIILEDPRYYSFFSCIGRSNSNCLIIEEFKDFYPEIDDKYLIGSGERIVKAVRTAGGFSQALIESLLIYILNTNRMIVSHLNFIAYNWADLHKNLHMELQQDGSSLNSELIKERNLSFDETITISGSVSALRYIKEQREQLNVLLEYLDLVGQNDKINIKSHHVEDHHHVVNALKTLAQTPFDFHLRKTFNERVDFACETLINRDDEVNIVSLPRIYNSQCKEEVQETSPDINIIMHPILRTAIWRNAFFDYNPHWKEEMNTFLNLSAEDQSEDAKKYLKPKFETIFRDNKKLSVHLLDCWMTLGSRFLSNSAANGTILISFLLDISCMPKANLIDNKVKVERALLGKKMVQAVKLIDPVHFNDILVAHLKSLWSDSPMVIEELEIKAKGYKKQKELQLVNVEKCEPMFVSKISVKEIEEFCRVSLESFSRFGERLRADPSCKFEIQLKFYSVLREFETSFRRLGIDLSDSLISDISKQHFLMKLLKIHGRAISRSQIVGLLHSEGGKLFLRENREIATKLIDYSAFTRKDLHEIGLEIDDIELNVSTLPVDIIIKEIVQPKRALKDPLAMIYNLGLNIWNAKNSKVNEIIWLSVNPLTIAFNYHPSRPDEIYESLKVTETKLNKLKSFSTEKLISFLIQWKIEQDWNCLIYTAALEIASKIQDEEKKTEMKTYLNEIYFKFLEIEFEAIQEILKWKLLGFKDNDDTVNDMINLLNFEAPLTSFREVRLKSLFKVSEDSEAELSFFPQRFSPNNLSELKLQKIVKYCPNNSSQLIAKLDSLSFFISSKSRLGFEPRAGIDVLQYKSALMSLGPWDSALLNVLLKMVGVDTANILNKNTTITNANKESKAKTSKKGKK